ncbi:hypothetical protein AB0K60_27030 [Thermopolyspora sp. NPDC052614]|uniref:hypothetical protein n=1 Tax=Thermopolyspora sp. NPDC052614 TaxID=3155682 RepID=UPI00343A6B55
MFAAALDAVVRLVRDPGGGRRRLSEICLLRRELSGLVTAAPALTFPATGAPIPGPAFPDLANRIPAIARLFDTA